jgi:hypothetical protein
MRFETLADILQNKIIHMLKEWHLRTSRGKMLGKQALGLFTQTHTETCIAYLTWRTRSIERCCLISLLNPSGKLRITAASSTPLVAAQWWRSYLLTLFLRRAGS